jgi:hypothetical protein
MHFQDGHFGGMHNVCGMTLYFSLNKPKLMGYKYVFFNRPIISVVFYSAVSKMIGLKNYLFKD